ncbi:MAG: hypothetical protein JXB36_18730, partial [Gammaproteobacteria bacterium]|nr:hypothetical protein [Gammaproteobacteria bacterium]
EDFGRFVPALRALHRHSAGGEPLPSLEWEFLPSPAGGLRLCVRGNPSPASVTTWSADSDDTDFRDDVFAAETIPAAVAAIASAGAEPTTHVIDVAAPESGFRAVFAEALLGQDDERYLLSTNLRVIDASGRPPFPDTVVDGSAGVCADARGRSNGTTAPER